MKEPLATATLLLITAGLHLRADAPGAKVPFVIRGQSQDLYSYPASGSAPKGVVVFAPGDGGWRGFAVEIAETVSSWGYRVFGFDTKRYLESFSGRTTLRETEVSGDMRLLAEFARPGPRDRVIFTGWSEGAGLGVLAMDLPQKQSLFRGFVAIGLPGAAVLGWRWKDSITWVTKKDPDEPHFSTLPYVPRIAPVPFALIHSSGDEYTGVADAKRLFAAALEPKRFSLVQARNHRFEGNRDGFFRALREALEWIGQASP